MAQTYLKNVDKTYKVIYIFKKNPTRVLNRLKKNL